MTNRDSVGRTARDSARDLLAAPGTENRNSVRWGLKSPRSQGGVMAAGELKGAEVQFAMVCLGWTGWVLVMWERYALHVLMSRMLVLSHADVHCCGAMRQAMT
eukprot:2290810-Rhodomonas_salina.2